MVAALTEGGRNYVSRLARELDIGLPLPHMHLQRLEAAGLVAGALGLSEYVKGMKPDPPPTGDKLLKILSARSAILTG